MGQWDVGSDLAKQVLAVGQGRGSRRGRGRTGGVTVDGGERGVEVEGVAWGLPYLRQERPRGQWPEEKVDKQNRDNETVGATSLMERMGFGVKRSQ